MATKTKAMGPSKDGSRRAPALLMTHNDISEENRMELVRLLNEQMADTFDLFSQTKQAHWNVKGPQFFQLHELYDTFAAQLIGYVDMLAERVTALGGVATGTVRMAADATRLEEFSRGPVGSMESVKMLVERYAALAETTREAIDRAEELEDMDTSDLFIEISRDLDKDLWFLEAHIQAGE